MDHPLFITEWQRFDIQHLAHLAMSALTLATLFDILGRAELAQVERDRAHVFSQQAFAIATGQVS